ncbi:AAA family ATPase [Capnocytophaga canimorsus]|uniref:AAA family ATPase n=1 Tax=Capnocytophaga canimorsus TaxID=28188 RepID=UPI0037D16E1A
MTAIEQKQLKKELFKLQMKIVKIKELRIENFKGIQNLTIPFENVTNIFGANATGKTTVFDAFTWLLFGKDSQGRKDFNIKNTKNTELNRQDHVVTGVVEIDGTTHEIKRVYREKWVKQRGALEATYNGNETLYYWDDLPLKQSDFNNRINEIISENIFKMITNPLAFNSLKWQDQRNVLIDIVGDVSYQEITAENPAFQEIIVNASKYANLDEYKKAINASIRKAKEDLKAIPTRIDEVLKSKPESIDFEALKNEVLQKETELVEVENQINDKNKAFDTELQKLNNKKHHLFSLKTEIENIARDLRKQAEESTKIDTSAYDLVKKELDHQKQLLMLSRSNVGSFENKLNNLHNLLQENEKLIDKKRSEWLQENENTLQFSDNEFVCPCCNRPYEADNIEAKKEEMLANFNKNKADKLAKIEKQASELLGQKTKIESDISLFEQNIETAEFEVSKLEIKVSELENQLQTEQEKLKQPNGKTTDEVYNELLVNNEQIKKKNAAISILEKELQKVPKVDNQALIEQKNNLKSDIESLKIELQKEAQIQQADNRIQTLKAEEKALAQSIANVEKEIYTADQLTKARIEKIESNINSKFKYVRFKLFDTQVNGGEVETCEALIDSVPFNNANTAGKINAGIDIINTLCDFYQVSAPIFIDNRESVSELIESKSQIINLFVSEQDKTLRIN